MRKNYIIWNIQANALLNSDSLNELSRQTQQELLPESLRFQLIRARAFPSNLTLIGEINQSSFGDRTFVNRISFH